MRVILALLLFVLVLLIPSKVYAFDEQIGDVGVPIEVSLSIQSVYQAYIIYSVKIVNGYYECVLARDGEPHQYPIRIITFNSNWQVMSDSGYFTPEVPKPVEQPKPIPVPPPVEEPEEERPARPERPQRPEKPEKPEKPLPEPEPMPIQPPQPAPMIPKPEEPKPEEKPPG